MWHVSFRSSEATSRTAIHLLLTYSFCYPRDAMLARAWASAHRGKWGQLTPLPWKNGWKIKKRKYAKRAVFYVYILRAIMAGRCRERRYADHIFIQIGLYFRMHHFVVKFSKFSSPGRQGGIDPPNQNPADVPGHGYWLSVRVCMAVSVSVTSRCHIETDGRDNLGFGMGTFFDQSFTTF